MVFCLHRFPPIQPSSQRFFSPCYASCGCRGKAVVCDIHSSLTIKVDWGCIVRYYFIHHHLERVPSKRDILGSKETSPRAHLWGKRWNNYWVHRLCSVSLAILWFFVLLRYKIFFEFIKSWKGWKSFSKSQYSWAIIHLVIFPPSSCTPSCILWSIHLYPNSYRMPINKSWPMHQKSHMPIGRTNCRVLDQAVV